MKKKTDTLFIGDIVNPLKSGKVEYLLNHALLVKQDGTIDKIKPASKITKQEKERCVVKDYSEQIICPGFIDCHIHLPQHPLAGLGQGALLEWLENYVFPLEKKCVDDRYAKINAQLFFDKLLKNGTTTACVYSSFHTKATDIAFDCAQKSGIRAFIGKVIMEEGVAPSGLSEPLEKAIEGCEYLIKKWHHKNNGKLQFIVTPRFALTSTKKGLDACGRLAEKHSLFIQTHCAENPEEYKQVLRQYSSHKNYVDVYDSAGLIGQKTLLAHCIYLRHDEEKILKHKQTTLVHCPCSNVFLKSGIFSFKKYSLEGMKIALGTDVGAGWSHSVLNEMKMCIEMSKLKSVEEKNPELLVSLEEAFCKATLHAAQSLRLDDKVGSFASGKEADLVILNDKQLNKDLFVLCKKSNGPSLRERFHRHVYAGSEHSILATFIKGKKVGGTTG